MTKLSKFTPSSTSRKVTWVRFHWNYIFICNFSYQKARQLASKIVSALSEQNISQASYFENNLFRIKKLTMFAAHEVLYWFRVIHFYITIQSNQSNCNHRRTGKHFTRGAEKFALKITICHESNVFSLIRMGPETSWKSVPYSWIRL